ncbi:protein kinase-like protein [Xylariomycetidae sp. FL0641]|nr:protein kinase-like protein [Xylariomycetidae sp. FL0641]
MTTRQPPALPDDLFANHDARSASHISGLSQHPGAPSLAALEDLNRRNVQSNQIVEPYRDDAYTRTSMSSRPSVQTASIPFESHTFSPSPPPLESVSEDPSASSNPPTYSHDSLEINTDFRAALPRRTDSLNSQTGGLSTSFSGRGLQHEASSSSLKPISRTPSLRNALSRNIPSAASSTYPSPVISAMGDVTPLPSPLLSSDSPGPWKRLGGRRPSPETPQPTSMPDSVLISASGESVASALAHQSKRRVYAGLNTGHAVETSSGKVEHTRNRSISEYIPDPKGIPKRKSTVSAGKPIKEEIGEPTDAHLRREPHLSEARGIVATAKPPTPPPSESSQSNDGPGSSSKRSRHEYFEARGRFDGKLRRWRAVKELGQGTFSRVMLATSHTAAGDDETKNATPNGRQPSPVPQKDSELDRKSLVAIKVCEHGPKGGASEDRIEMSLKRELDIMQSVNHPSIAHLKAWSIEPTRALLVLSYCPGGDLFDVATTHRDSLTSSLLRRIFSEVVGAVSYLHERRIVHRDIKLENVLVNIPATELQDTSRDWATYPYSVTTLTDLGLSRRVADDEKLETRCGSDDYAAPEVILGQPYDGRAIDCWSLGVMLYALIESRLPFDPPPGASDAQRMRSRTSHRIARVEWSWYKYAGEDGYHDANEALFERDGLKGAMEITEGFLQRARSRWPMQKAAEHEWVKGGVQVEGGIKFREEEEGEEVL